MLLNFLSMSVKDEVSQGFNCGKQNFCARCTRSLKHSTWMYVHERESSYGLHFSKEVVLIASGH